MSAPVTDERIQIAKTYGLASVDESAIACRMADLPFWASCTLSEIESDGKNVYGHDAGGVNSLPRPQVMKVTAVNYHDFIIKVMNGALSNGVGPRQITFAGSLVNCTGGNGRNGGYFREMAELGLLPWLVLDNIYFGDMVLARYEAKYHSWWTAARLYNGKTSYADTWVRLANQWRERLNISGGPI